jgi:hypothetical protein
MIGGVHLFRGAKPQVFNGKPELTYQASPPELQIVRDLPGPVALGMVLLRAFNEGLHGVVKAAGVSIVDFSLRGGRTWTDICKS